jgi:glycerophosphoryl diester phosphodiesterase
VSRPLIIAHRGDSERRPENTLAAFRSALEAGVDSIELDVQLTCDGHVLVIHDERVDRTTDGQGLVSSMTLDEVRALSAGYPARFGDRFEAERVPTLAEALELLHGRVRRVMVELKRASSEEQLQEGIEARTIELVRRVGMIHEVALISFDARALAWARALAPEAARGQLFAHGEPEAVVRSAVAAGAAVVIVEKAMLSEELCQRARAAGLRIGAWLVDDPSELAELRRFGLYGIGTNRPHALLQTLADEPPVDEAGAGETHVG